MDSVVLQQIPPYIEIYESGVENDVIPGSTRNPKEFP